MKRNLIHVAALTWTITCPLSVSAKTQLIEIGAGNTQDLPGGREADGIIGDFVLRNDRIEALVSGNQHERRPNFTIFGDSPTPGCLYDLTPRGENNDQITYFGPGRHSGKLSSVLIVKDGSDGEAVLRAELTAAAGNGLAKRHEYVLRDGWRHLVIISTYHNTTDKPMNIKPGAAWLGLESVFGADGITSGLCQDPDDKIGYANSPVSGVGEKPEVTGPGSDLWKDAEPAQGETALAPGAQRRFAVALAVGRGSADAYGVIASLTRKVVRFSGRIVEPGGKPAVRAALYFPKGDNHLVAFVDAEGRFDLMLPPDMTHAVARDLGRPDVALELKTDQENLITVEPASGVSVEVDDDQGSPLPSKVQFQGVDGTQTPNLGPGIRAHGCDNQYHTETGRFSQALPPGKYSVTVTRGIEYDHAMRTIEVKPGEFSLVKVALKRVVDTRGWISTDFHNHTTQSGDNYCGTDDRIINLAAEHIEFAPATEHNRIYDWQPHIDRLKLDRHVRTTTGIELTGSGPHLNAFPLKSFPHRQDNGAPRWDPDPRINALVLRRLEGDKKNRWVHLNHPNVASYFNDWNNDKQADGGFAHLESFIDAGEFFMHTILTDPAKRTGDKDDRSFDWLQLINAGRPMWTIAVSDAHRVVNGGVGAWRMYVRSSHDEPASLDIPEILDNARKGRTFITTGPFLEVATAAGDGPGHTVRATGSLKLHVRVQATTWIELNRVAVLVNGRVAPELDFRKAQHPEMFKEGTLRFEQDVEVPLTGDAHLIVAAVGEGATLETSFSRGFEGKWTPIAYHNPIFVDTDGNGFTPNGDTLGQPYLRYGQRAAADRRNE